MLLLLTYWIITGITAEDVSEVHYRLENSSICLHVKHPPPHGEPRWLLPALFVVSKGGMNSALEKKVDYDSENKSLCIKNLTNADSGVYEFSFSNSAYYSVHEKHRIIVQGQVPRPDIIMSELDANTSTGVCNISVNCSIQSDWLWSFCDADACRTAQASLSEASISISISINISISGNRTVVCRGNNRVSTESDSRRMPTTCRSQSKEPELKDPDQQLLLILLVVTFCLCLLVFITFVARKLLTLKHDQTSTTHLIQNQQAEAPTQREPRVSTSSSVAYENVDAIRPSETSGTRDEPWSTHGQAVNTVYSVLQPAKGKPPQGTSDNSKAGRGPQETQEASASQAEPQQIDTVYSMLQKPGHKQ